MAIAERYRTPADLPRRLPVFPLPGALLLPRADVPLNIFEPRYLAMIGDALSGERLIGMIQPEEEAEARAPAPKLYKVGCAGRITAYAETPDDRLLITLTGVSRFAVVSELRTTTLYRQVEADFSPYADDLVTGQGQDAVDRAALLKTFKDYLDANGMRADWDEVEQASTEVLVNTLSLLAPYAVREKQALLEAADLKTRADVLVALTEMALARTGASPHARLQ